VVCNTVGVPLISPVDESMFRPLGNDGEMAHELTTPPPLEGVVGDIETPLVSVMFSWE